MTRKMILLLVLAVLVGGVVLFLKHGDTNALDEVPVSGQIEVTQVDLAFKVPGRIAVLQAEEGDAVSVGQLVAELDPVDARLAVAAAEAARAYQQALLDEVLAGSRQQEVKEAQAALGQARAAHQVAVAQLQQARQDQMRFANLYREGSTSRRTLELYETALEQSRNGEREAQAAVRQAEERLSLVSEGARSEAIASAQARLRMADATLAQARQQLAETRLNSPLTGRILSRPAEVGEYIQPGNLVFSGAVLDPLWARVYVNESDLGRIRLGQRAEMVSDSWPGQLFPGTVTFIADEAEFTPKAVQTYSERIQFMYRVKITLANPDQRLKPGMPVEGRILTASP
ncbi:MAG: efflux RND transporter periplasmic adaptor subunit [Desulfuromonadaceae bacterium]|nr:efflux RND transporter periplasmic adaptor subunit [Desulfuromonadaceae bacterium]